MTNCLYDPEYGEFVSARLLGSCRYKITHYPTPADYDSDTGDPVCDIPEFEEFTNTRSNAEAIARRKQPHSYWQVQIRRQWLEPSGTGVDHCKWVDDHELGVIEP